MARKSEAIALPYPVGDMENGQEQAGASREAAAKAIDDLDALVQAVLTSLPPSKPWQRQLLQHLREIDRTTQVLRMTISLERASGEIAQAKEQLRIALRVAQNYVAMGRGDFGTKAAVRLAYEIGLRVDATVA